MIALHESLPYLQDLTHRKSHGSWFLTTVFAIGISDTSLTCCWWLNAGMATPGTPWPVGAAIVAQS